MLKDFMRRCNEVSPEEYEKIKKGMDWGDEELSHLIVTENPNNPVHNFLENPAVKFCSYILLIFGLVGFLLMEGAILLIFGLVLVTGFLVAIKL